MANFIRNWMGSEGRGDDNGIYTEESGSENEGTAEKAVDGVSEDRDEENLDNGKERAQEDNKQATAKKRGRLAGSKNKDKKSEKLEEGRIEKFIVQKKGEDREMETNSEYRDDRGKEDTKMIDIMSKMLHNLEMSINRNIRAVKEETKLIRKENSDFKESMFKEIETLRKDMDRKQKEWELEKKLLSRKVESLEEDLLKCKEVLEGNRVATLIKEEVRKLNGTNNEIENFQREERWWKTAERKVEEITQEVCKEKMEKQLEQVNRKMEREERKNRRPNIIIRGLQVRGKDLKKEVEEFFDRKLQARGVIKKTYRMKMREESSSEEGENRSKISDIMVQMDSIKDKKEIMKNRGKLKGSKVYVDDDLTRTEREIQRSIRERARQEIERGKSVKQGYMKLVIDGKCWKWDEDKKELRNRNF